MRERNCLLFPCCSPISGVQSFFSTFTQISPVLLTFGCQIFVVKYPLGGLAGKSAGSASFIRNTPLSKGVPGGPSISAAMSACCKHAVVSVQRRPRALLTLLSAAAAAAVPALTLCALEATACAHRSIVHDIAPVISCSLIVTRMPKSWNSLPCSSCSSLVRALITA